MPKRLSLQPHLSPEQLFERYRQATDPVVRSQFQILWLLATAHTTEQVQTATGYCLRWIRLLARRYNEHGPTAIRDRRHANPGGKPMLDEFQLSQLLQVLQQPLPNGSHHTSYTVARWMAEQLDRPVSAQRGWEYLKLCERSLQAPRPMHAQADQAEQEAFKKTAGQL